MIVMIGQAGAMRLGISKALLAFPGNHGDILEEGVVVMILIIN
jgi:ribosomal protein S9